jgi:predicted flavoprotein YhiN
VPDLARDDLATALRGFQQRQPLKAVANVNPFGLPKRLWAAVVCGQPSGAAHAADADAVHAVHAVDPLKPWRELSKRDLAALEERTCRAQLPFAGKDSNKDEFVTAGGVCWSSVDSTRMESRHAEGLFFAGELLNIDGVTGGHNFQSCWTTGYVAGTAAAECSKASAQPAARV